LLAELLDVVAGGVDVGSVVVVGVAVMIGGTLPPPELLFVVAIGPVEDGTAAGVAVITGGSFPPDWGWTAMAPPWLLLELVAVVPPDWELLAFMPPDWKLVAAMPPKLAPSPGCLVPLELVARMPPTELETCLPPP
jgi:hypothetical protein